MIKRIIYYVIGLLITTLGIAIVIHSTVGVGPWDAVFVGANSKLNLTIGTWSIIIQLLLVAVTAILAKKRPIVECVIPIIIRGILLDFWMLVVLANVSFAGTTIYFKWSLFFAGLALLGFGLATYMQSKLPPTPIDGFVRVISEKFKIGLDISRTIVEVLAVIIAIFLGGPVGLGTIIMALSLGYIIQNFSNVVKTIYDR